MLNVPSQLTLLFQRFNNWPFWSNTWIVALGSAIPVRYEPSSLNTKLVAFSGAVLSRKAVCFTSTLRLPAWSITTKVSSSPFK